MRGTPRTGGRRACDGGDGEENYAIIQRMATPPLPAPAEAGTLRRLLLAVVLLGSAGLAAELVLLEHFEDWQQWVPFVVLGAALGTAALVVLRPGRRALAAFRAVMVASLAAGALGVWFHYRGNVEFELEREPSLRGLALFWEAMRGATPALAPGAMVQLGLLGLIAAYRHPLEES